MIPKPAFIPTDYQRYRDDASAQRIFQILDDWWTGRDNGFGPTKNVYSGVSANTVLSDGDIAALTVQALSGRRFTTTLTPSAQYLYFVIPDSFGTPVFKVNGVITTAWIQTVQSYDSDTYNVFRSINLLTSSDEVIVQ